MTLQVPCPHCATPVDWGPQSPSRPFCSERCRLIDLGAWLDESHRIADSEDSLQAPGEPREDMADG